MKRFLLVILLLLTPSIVTGQSISTTTCPGAGCADLNVGGQGSIGIQITGTWVGTITFRASLSTDPSGTFTDLLVTPTGSTTAVTTTTGNGIWTTPVAGINVVRVVFTAYTSGTAIVTRRVTLAARKGSSGGGGGGSGTVTEVDTSSPITGGPITTTGTIGCPTCGVTGSPLSQFAATTSAQFAGVITNELGSGSVLFGDQAVLSTSSPTFNALTVSSCTGCGSGAPTNATYITQTPDATLSAEQALSALSTGILRVATATGIVTSLTDSAGIAANISDETGSGPLVFGTSPVLTSQIDIGAAGVRLSAADGVLTLLGLGNGNDENLTIDLDNAAANTIALASGTSAATITWTGAIAVGDGAVGTPSLTFASETNSGFYRSGAGVINFANSGSRKFFLGTNQLGLEHALNLRWFTAGFASNSLELTDADAASDILRQSNGTAAQTFRIYETLTDASNYERGAFTTGSNLLTIAWETAGTGSDDGGISLVPAGTGFVTTNSMAAAGATPAVANVGANSCGTTAATIAGNNNTGFITVGATAGTQCRVTFTKASPTRWQCTSNNETTANLARTTSVSTTQMDFFGTFNGGDVVSYICMAR